MACSNLDNDDLLRDRSEPIEKCLTYTRATYTKRERREPVPFHTETPPQQCVHTCSWKRSPAAVHSHTFSAFSNPNPSSVQSANLPCIIYGCWGAPKMLIKAKWHSQRPYSHLFLSPFFLPFLDFSPQCFLPPFTVAYVLHLFSPTCHLFFFHHLPALDPPLSRCFKLPPVNTCLFSLLWFLLPFSLPNKPSSSKHICLSV